MICQLGNQLATKSVTWSMPYVEPRIDACTQGSHQVLDIDVIAAFETREDDAGDVGALEHDYGTARETAMAD